MSETLWDTGRVAACLCRTFCARCGAMDQCLQLTVVQGADSCESISLCLVCWSDLSLRISEQCMIRLQQRREQALKELQK